MTIDRVARIRSCLETAFAPLELEVRDDSHLHEGHAGAQSGKGHFSVIIISTAFTNARPIDRHRMVFDALGDMMHTDIHALSVSASPPNNKNSN